MRGDAERQANIMLAVTPDSFIPDDHPIRRIKPIVDAALQQLSPLFDTMYSISGRPSIPPEHLLKASLLIALYSIRSERQFCERLRYDLLFKWFLDLNISDEPFDASTFSKNRERLLAADVARAFFAEVVAEAKRRRLLSAEHFTVDGTLLERSTSGRATLGADRGYDTRDFVAALRGRGVTPHVARNDRRSRSAVDGRTTRHRGYRQSQKRRKIVEPVFGWMKTVGGGRKLRFVGRERNRGWLELTAAAYNRCAWPGSRSPRRRRSAPSGRSGSPQRRPEPGQEATSRSRRRLQAARHCSEAPGRRFFSTLLVSRVRNAL